MTPEEARRVLGLSSPCSTLADIESAFRRSAKHHHPDVQRDALARHAAEERFRRVLEARRTLRAVAAAGLPRSPTGGPAAPRRVPRGGTGRRASVDRSLVGCGGWIIAGWAAWGLFSPWWLLLPMVVTLLWARRRGSWSRGRLLAAALDVGRTMAAAGVAAAVAITLASVL